MVNIVGIRFSDVGKIYNFSPAGIDIEVGDYAVVETIRGVEIGQVVLGPRDIPKEENIAPLKDIIRKANDEDREAYFKNKADAQDAIPICKEKIDKHKLDMKIISAEYTFDRNKFIVYFTADGRVDFRELVRDLASIFKTRIELRQIGVRDEAKALGGIGSCGRKLCCNKFLGDFEPVSIQMAKDQSLSLNPSKISGLCGRLMCCLNYECQVYEEKLKKMPDIGLMVETPEGWGRVVETETLSETVTVKIKKENDLMDLVKYNIEELKLPDDFNPKSKKVSRDEIDEELSALEE